MEGLLTKSIASAKMTDEGEITAVIANIGRLDHDKDYLEKGAFGQQEVAISAWGHDWSKEPTGRGVVFEQGDNVLFKGKFFDTPAGQAAHAVAREMSKSSGSDRPNGILEWSYGFHLKDGGYAEREIDGNTQSVFVMKDIDAFEVSPVYRGAGVNTYTIEAKRKKALEFQEESGNNDARIARRNKANMAKFRLEESLRKWGHDGSIGTA